MFQEKYYTLHEIAKILKVSYMTVFRSVKSEKLKSIKVGKQHRVSLEMFNKFIENKNK